MRRPASSAGSLSLLGLLGLLIPGCQSHPAIRTEPQVDLDRFMGDWYVIAHIPTSIEAEAYNAVESYRREPGNRIATTFRFNDGGLDGPVKVYHPTGFVRDESNAVWGMQFWWPFKAEFRVVYVNEDYTQTVIGRTKRDYVWIMARDPAIPEGDYRSLVDLIVAEGYELGQLRRVPHAPQSSP